MKKEIQIKFSKKIKIDSFEDLVIEVKDSNGILLVTVPTSNVKLSSDDLILTIKPNLSESSDFENHQLSIKPKSESSFPITSIPDVNNSDG